MTEVLLFIVIALQIVTLFRARVINTVIHGVSTKDPERWLKDVLEKQKLNIPPKKPTEEK